MWDFLHFPEYFAIFDDFSEFCSIFGTLHFEKSLNTAKNLEKMKKNLSIILLLKWPLFQPKMFTMHYCWFLSDISRYRANTFSPLFSTLKQKVFSPCLLCSTCRETIILCATLTQVQKECLSRLQLILCLECKYLQKYNRESFL